MTFSRRSGVLPTIAVPVALLALVLAGPVQAQDLDEDLWSNAMECEHEAVASLLEKGANPNAADEYGYTALIHAAGSGCLETVEVLLAASADPNLRNEDGGFALFDAVGAEMDVDIEEERRDHAKIVELLLDAGADKNMKGPDGMTALEFARRIGLPHIVALLE